MSGYDHLLFVAGLVIATLQLRQLVWTISAFTIAHSITLGLGMLQVVTPNSTAVELLIALSIAYVGYENLSGTPRGRVWIVMAFGLAHGFGFAGAIADIGLPKQRELAALALFNLGVEAGQLSVVAVLWPLLVQVRKHARVELVVSRAVNVVLVIAGLGWTLQRSLTAPEPPRAVQAIEPSTVLASVSAAREPAPSFETPAWARSVCHALQTLPRERRAQCAGVRPGVSLEGACESALSAALARNLLQVDTAGAEACTSALQARYEGCAWTSDRVLPPVPACQGFVLGTLAQGASCASSLECEAGLHCHGAGAFDRGVCGLPRQDGARCELAADPLASYIPAADAAHPECKGRCIRGRCAEARARSLRRQSS